MVFQVRYEWNIDYFGEFTETKTSKLFSPFFFASPDEISHRWKVGLRWGEQNPDFYGIFLCLVDNPKKHIFAKFSVKVYNKENEVVGEEIINRLFVYVTSKGFGPPAFVDSSKYPFTCIQKICLEIELVREKPLEPKPIVCYSTETLPENLFKLYESGDFSDITIICEEHKFKVHKQILVSRSSVFKTMFENDMMESISKTIPLEDVDPEAVKIFIKLLYTSSIEIPPTLMEDILDLSEKYDIQDLKQISTWELELNLSVLTAVDYLVLADRYQLKKLKEGALILINRHLEELIPTESWQEKIKHRIDLMEEIFAFIALHKKD